MKIQTHLSIGYIGAEHTMVMDVPDKELEGMSEKEKRHYIVDEYLIPWSGNYIDCWYEEV